MEEKYDEVPGPRYSVFCNKLVRYLFKKSGLSYSPVKECPFFTFEIVEAVATISNIYQKEYRKTFSYISTSLKTRGVLEKCSMLIPVKKDGCYFFNFLRRISIIFELARNCLVHFQNDVNNEDYFGIVLKCIENYPDLMYFNISGGWEGLQNTADFLVKLGLPLKLLMRYEVLQETSIQTSSDAIEKLNKEMLDSKEGIFLDDLFKIYKANSKIVTSEKRSSPSPVDHSKDAKGNLKSEKEVLMEYVAKCLVEGKNMEVFSSEIPPFEIFQGEQPCISPNTTGLAGKECEAGTQMIPTKPSVSDEPPKGTPDKVAEHISDGKEKDAQYNFIVPGKYFLTNDEGNSDECKYLYTAKINPPYKREKMTKSLKEMLDRNFDNNNYRLMPSGDYFVSPPDSTAEETLFVFVDSSADEDSDEDMNTLVCFCKKNDLDEFEKQKNEGYYLRPRKPAMHRRDSPRKASSSKISQTLSRESIVQSSIDNEDKATAHTKYLSVQRLTSLYKKYLPIIFQNVERYRTYLSLNKTTPDEEEYGSEPEESGPSNVERKPTLFLIDAALLSQRKVELEEQVKYDLVLGLSESPVLIRHYNPGILPPKQDRKLNYFIKEAKYSQIYNGVFIAGELPKKSEIWYLFAQMKSTQSEDEYRRDTLRVAELYKKAVLYSDDFRLISREYITSVVTSICRTYGL